MLQLAKVHLCDMRAWVLVHWKVLHHSTPLHSMKTKWNDTHRRHTWILQHALCLVRGERCISLCFRTYFFCGPRAIVCERKRPYMRFNDNVFEMLFIDAFLWFFLPLSRRLIISLSGRITEHRFYFLIFFFAITGQCAIYRKPISTREPECKQIKIQKLLMRNVMYAQKYRIWWRQHEKIANVRALSW